VRTYRGVNQGTSDHVVTVEDDDAGELCLLAHRMRHSPSGFSWGYAGSGPADLARSIMWEHLGAEPHPACYQAFKFSFVAGWPQGGDWQITDEEIEVWLDEYVATHVPGQVRLSDDDWMYEL
jgi:Family of unknown function (DUF6166)